MISIGNVRNWKNKVFLAPNASGKSRMSKYLFDDYSEKSKIRLFSLDTIQDLVSVDTKKIFIGINSKYYLEENKIKDIIDYSDFFKKFIKDNYSFSSISARNIKEKSYFFNSIDLKNTKSLDFFDILLTISKDIEKVEGFDEKSVFKADVSFDIDLLNDIKNHILDKVLTEELNEDYDYNNVIPKDVMASLNYLENYSRTNNLKRCILCGNEEKDILDVIKNNISRYVEEDKDNLIQTICRLYEKCKLINYNSSSESLSSEEKMEKLLDYYRLAQKNNLFVLSSILNIKIADKNLYMYIDEYRKIDNKISEEEKSNDEIKKFYAIVEEEFKKLVTLPDKLKLDFSNNAMELKINDELQDISKTLSTSELKRLGLAVLNAEIDSSIIDYVIFDDPIDSYDDYYIRIASIYIANMMYNKNIDFTVFTHLYEFCYYISLVKSGTNGSKSSKFEFYLYYQDPTFKIKRMHNIDFNKILKFKKIKSNDILDFNKNELFILKGLLDSKNTDSIFVLLSMFPSIRSLTNDINMTIQQVSYKNSKVKKIVDKIEESYLHYSNTLLSSTKDFTDLAKKILQSKIKKSGSKICECKNERKKYLNKKLDEIEVNNIMFKIVLFKMLRIQECKFLMEEKLFKILEENNIQNSVIKGFINMHTLGKKIKFAKENCTDDNILKIEEIHNKYSTLINDYSHGLTRMFPPYLMSNVIDIAKMEFEISKV